MNIRRAMFTLMTLALSPLCPVDAKAPLASAEEIMKKLGIEPIRAIDDDICFPSTGEEYEALGKNAILMVRSSTAVSAELPLRTVYAMYKGTRIPLQRIYLLDKTVDPTTSKAEQVSFYLLPIKYMKGETDLRADFTGERKGFGFHSFTVKEGMDKNAPAFARLDEYDTPGDADTTTVAAVLAREYPQYIH